MVNLLEVTPAPTAPLGMPISEMQDEMNLFVAGINAIW